MKLQKNKILDSLKQNKYLELFPNLKEEKTQKITSVMLTFVALSFFGIFAINPTISTIAGLQKELSDSQSTDTQLIQKINNLSSLGKQYQLLQNDIPNVISAIPQDPQISLLVAQLQSLTKAAGVNLISLQTLEVEVTTPITTQKKFSSFAFSLAAEGNYSSIMKLVDSVVNMQRVLSLDTIAINKKADQSGLVQLSLKGTAYFKN